MEIVNIIIIFFASLLTIIWFYGIRRYAKLGNRASQANINSTFLFIISLLVVFIFNISPLHLLWMFPASAIIGLLYLNFPFILVNIPATYLERLAYLGLDHNKIRDLKFEVEDVIELMTKEKLTKEEAIKRVKNRRDERRSN